MAEGSSKINIGSREYDIDDFEGRELVDAERQFGISLLGELDRGSLTGVYAILYLVKKREDASVTVDSVLKLNLADVLRLMGDDEETESDPPSKPAAKAKAAKSG